MRSTRRTTLKLMMAALSSLAAPGRGLLAAGSASRGKPLRILILGGTGFTGPHQVRYALARGHKITLFNRGKQPHEWPGEVEELIGDFSRIDLEIGIVAMIDQQREQLRAQFKRVGRIAWRGRAEFCVCGSKVALNPQSQLVTVLF